MHFRLFIIILECFDDLLIRFIDLFFDYRYHGITVDSDMAVLLSVLSPSHDSDYCGIYFNSNPNTANILRNPWYYRQYRPYAGL